jgi:hypothetical protein
MTSTKLILIEGYILTVYHGKELIESFEFTPDSDLPTFEDAVKALYGN